MAATPPAPGWRSIESLGRAAIRLPEGVLEELDFLAVVLMSAGSMPRGEWPFLIRHTWQQIYFTAVQQAYLFTAVGAIIGVLTAFPLIVFRIEDPHLLGRIMHIMMYHQLNPILATLFVAVLSGAAITAELGELRANQAIEHLVAMGVNPHSFFVLPRLIGMAVSLPILVLWLNIGVTVGAAPGAGGTSAKSGGTTSGALRVTCISSGRARLNSPVDPQADTIRASAISASNAV